MLTNLSLIEYDIRDVTSLANMCAYFIFYDVVEYKICTYLSLRDVTSAYTIPFTRYFLNIDFIYLQSRKRDKPNINLCQIIAIRCINKYRSLIYPE